MFATLLGALPLPMTTGGEVAESRVAEDEIDALIVAAIRSQEKAGLEPVTDGRLRDPSFDRLAAVLGNGRSEEPVTVPAWKFATSRTERAVKQALPGPYSLGWRRVGTAGRISVPAQWLVGSAKRDLRERERRTMAYADALRREIEELAAAGCPLVELEETEAHQIGDDESERRLFHEAHRILTDGVTGTHLSLSIVGGSAAGAGIETMVAAPYASLAVDLIAGPDNWNLVTRLPGDRGVVAGAMAGREEGDEPTELLLWAAHYAASTGARGIARVGLGSAGSWANLTWAAAFRKMHALGTAARLAQLPPGDEILHSLEPRSVSTRIAALGPDAPKPPRRRRLLR